MEAQRTRQFVVDHTFVSAAIFGLLVSSVTLVVTLAATGSLSGIRQGSTDAEVAEAAVIIPDDRIGIGAMDARKWSLGDAYGPSLGEGWVGGGAPAQEGAVRGTDRADQMAGVGERGQIETGDSQSAATFEDMERAPSLYTKPKTATGPAPVEDWVFMEQNPDVFARPKVVGPGPGEGLNDYKFIEENTQLPDMASAHAEGLPGLQNSDANGY
jgi:hypothetical protein